MQITTLQKSILTGVFMMKRLIVIGLSVIMLVGCGNKSMLSEDLHPASKVAQVQSLTYGTLVGLRAVQIQGDNEDSSNVISAIGGAILGGFLGNTVAAGNDRRRFKCCR